MIGKIATSRIERSRRLSELKKDNKYQMALNDIISNSGTGFNCKHDSFYLMQELIDKYLLEHDEDGTFNF